MLTWGAKYPDEVLHYQIDWADALATGDSVASADAPQPEGITLSAVGTVGTLTTVTIAGGSAGMRAIVQLTAVTTLGETLGEDVAIAINTR